MFSAASQEYRLEIVTKYWSFMNLWFLFGMEMVRFTEYPHKFVIIVSLIMRITESFIPSSSHSYIYWVGRMSFLIYTCVSVQMNSTKSDLWNHNYGVLWLEGSVQSSWQWKCLGTMVAVDHNNSEDGKGNLSPLFTSQHKVSIVGAALKPWCWGKLMTFLWHVKWLFTVATRQGQTLLATYLAFCQ